MPFINLRKFLLFLVCWFFFFFNSGMDTEYCQMSFAYSFIYWAVILWFFFFSLLTWWITFSSKYFLISLLISYLPMGYLEVQFSHSVLSHSLGPHGLQHTRLPCPSPAPGVCSNSSTSSQWCHPAISSSVVPFSSCLQSFPVSGSFPMSQFFTSGGQSIGVSASASVLPVNIQDWFPLGWTDWISLESKRFSRVFTNTTVQKHQLLGAQLSL